MPNVICGLAALSVAGVFYTYRAYTDYIKSREHTLRERVTYMLWVMANSFGDDSRTPALGARG